jgi:Sulfotransferase family
MGSTSPRGDRQLIPPGLDGQREKWGLEGRLKFMAEPTSGNSPIRIAFHIGWHKTATTWFQRVGLQCHPNIVACFKDEPFVRHIIRDSDFDFDPDSVRTLLIERSTALQSDQLLVASAERLSGHAASGGYDTVRIANRIHAVAPEAKVFVLIRHQSEAIRSEYKQIVSLGWTGSVEQTLRTAPHVKTVGVDPAYWEYDRLLATYAKLFGSDNVLALDYGRFSQDQSSVLDELATFLGIARWELDQSMLNERVNRSQTDGQAAIRRRLNIFRESELNPNPPAVVPQRILDAVALRLGSLARKPLFDASFDDWVDGRYSDSNKRLAQEWGITLARAGR